MKNKVNKKARRFLMLRTHEMVGTRAFIFSCDVFSRNEKRNSVAAKARVGREFNIKESK